MLTVSNNLSALEFDSDSASLDFSGESGGLQTFLTSASLSPGALFESNPWDVLVSIQNTLTAYTDANGEKAWIQKKLSFVASEVAIVPVPAAVWLFGSSLLGLGVLRKKRC